MPIFNFQFPIKCNWIGWRIKKTPIRNPQSAITEAQLSGRFSAAPDNPLFEAVLALLADRINNKATDAANEQLTDRAILWRLAGTDALMEFYEELLERESRARQEQAETSGPQNMQR